MYKLMVVDDEQIVLQGVQFIIDKYMDNVEITTVARSGREAIEKIEEYRPHIILMDIRMPGINGIEAIKEIKKRDSSIRFIIVSAYEQFEFAKEAVALGVTDYIIKPVNRYKLIEAIDNTIKLIQKEKDFKQRELENIEKLNKVIPMLENGFIYSIIMNSEFDEEMTTYRELFDIRTRGGYMVVVQFGEGDSASSLDNKIGAGIQGERIYTQVKEVLKYKTKCVVGPIIINRLVIFIPSMHYEDSELERNDSLTLVEQLVHHIEKLTKTNFFIGIGSYKELGDLYQSYDEALKALWYNNGERFLHIMDITNYYNTEIQKLKNIKENILKNALAGRTDKLNDLCNEYASKVNAINLNDKSTKIIKNQILEMMVIINREAIDLGIEDRGQNEGYISILDSSMSLYEAVNRSILEINDITNEISSLKSNQVSISIKNAIDYISQNYTKELTLEDVACEVSMSPQYLSKIFKEETGKSFIEYLTSLRLDVAKELLTNSDLTKKEISYQVGYNDPNYFSRLFKKQIGLTPTEYVKNSIN